LTHGVPGSLVGVVSPSVKALPMPHQAFGAMLLRVRRFLVDATSPEAVLSRKIRHRRRGIRAT
jgi:hypothetical protein